jgi:hypothetical protein
MTRGIRKHGYVGRRLETAIKAAYLRWSMPKEEKPSGNPKTLEERRRLRALRRDGEIELGTGKLPEGFWELPRPNDPAGSIRAALIQERREGV